MLIITKNVVINLWIVDNTALCYQVLEQSEALSRTKFNYLIDGIHITSKQKPYILPKEIGLRGCLEEYDTCIDIICFDNMIDLFNFIGRISQTLTKLDKLIEKEKQHVNN